MSIETFIREKTSYAALSDTFNAAMNATLGCDSSQCSMLFLLAYANGKGPSINDARTFPDFFDPLPPVRHILSHINQPP